MGADTTRDLAEMRPELAKTLALMRLMSATGGTVSLSGPALTHVLAELEAGETRTEWGAKWADGGYCPSTPATSEEYARKHARTFGTRPIRRGVGPWVYADTGEHAFPWVPVEDEAGA